MKTAYTLQTNHDGILGVYTSKKQVHEAIKREFDTNLITVDLVDKRKYSYQTLCKYLDWIISLESSKFNTQITVQRFNVNQ